MPIFPHTISPQNILEGALVLGRAAPFFPAGTVHLAVIDPGVGTERRAIAARLGKTFFVGPDNGLCTPLLEDAEAAGEAVEFVKLENMRYWLPQVSRTFHGRDIFAPAAAHLATGVPLKKFGSAIQDPLRVSLPKPEKTASGWRAHVTRIDNFGNLATDLPGLEVVGKEDIIIRIGSHELRGLVEFYGQRPEGGLVALVDGAGYLEIALVNGSAARLLGVLVGSSVEVIFHS